MQRRISDYIISLLLLLVSFTQVQAQKPRGYATREEAAAAQQYQQSNKKEKKVDAPKVIMPFFNGIYVSADLYGLGSNLLGSDFLSSEIGVSANLKNRYMPTVEIGYGKTDTWNENGIHYKSSAPYFRAGADYNFRFKKADYEDVLFLGLRLGYSSFSYDVENASITDPAYGGVTGNPNLNDSYWPGSYVFKKTGMDGSMSWYEIVAGMRTQIFKNFFMGWSLRLRYKLSVKMDESAHPWYVPGFGKYGAKSTGITYSIIYKFSLGAKKPVIILPNPPKNNDQNGKIKVKHTNSAPFNKK